MHTKSHQEEDESPRMSELNDKLERVRETAEREFDRKHASARAKYIREQTGPVRAQIRRLEQSEQAAKDKTKKAKP